MEKEIKSKEEIIEMLNAILENNNIKIGSKKAKETECRFLQGVMFADSRYLTNMPILTINIMSGRSLLDK